MILKVDKIIKCNTKFIETEEFKKEFIEKSYGIYDNWISEGLYAKIYDIEEKEVDLTTYYSNNEFSLFGARFFQPFSSREEIENVKSASKDLVEYLLKNDKKTELLKNDIKVSYMESWAKEKGIDLGYQSEIESLMNRMEVYDIADKFIINTKEEINGFKIDISIAEIEAQYSIAEQYNTAEKIEQIILRFDRDVLAIQNGIEQDSPRFYAEYKEILNNVPKIEYIFDTTNSYDPIDGGFFFKGTNKTNLRDINSHAHEYCHLFFYNPFMEKDITITRPKWLNEGNEPMDLMNEGDTMDYHKNFSFFNYLIEEYGLEKMLYLNVADFNGLTYKEVFGKTFKELKVDWMNYLQENIRGIESIL